MPNRYVTALCLFFLSVAASAETDVLGYFEADPDFGGARNRFCIEVGTNGLVHVGIATAYCPSQECMNSRIDGMQFEAPLKAQQIHYVKKPGCSVRIKFLKGGAKVWRDTSSCSDEHPYFYAEGWYNFVASTPDRSSCRLE